MPLTSKTTGLSRRIGFEVWREKVSPRRPPVVRPISEASRFSVISR